MFPILEAISQSESVQLAYRACNGKPQAGRMSLFHIVIETFEYQGLVQSVLHPRIRYAAMHRGKIDMDLSISFKIVQVCVLKQVA